MELFHRSIVKVGEANLVSFLNWTSILAPNWWYNYLNLVSGDLATTLMIFG